MEVESSLWFVYALRCPLAMNVKYVGMTRNLRKRLNLHIDARHKCSSPNESLRLWLVSLWEEKLIPAMSVLHVVNSKREAMIREQEEITSRNSEELLNIQHATEYPGCEYVLPPLNGAASTIGMWARELGMSRQRLYQRIRSYGVNEAIAGHPRKPQQTKSKLYEENYGLSHAERKARRRRMADMIRSGKTVKEVATEFDVTTVTVNSAIREFNGVFTVREFADGPSLNSLHFEEPQHAEA